jgi:imidazolonepropionase
VENLLPARHAIEVSAAGRVVMPSFVDSHTHLLFPAPGAPAGDLETALHSLRATTAMQLKMRATAYLQAMVRHGTTTVEIKTGSGMDAAAELKILRVLAELRDASLDIVPTFLCRAPQSGGSPDDSPEVWEQIRSEFLPRISRRRMVAFADLMWDDFALTLWKRPANRRASIAGYFEVASNFGLGRKLHADAKDVSAAVLAAAEHHAVTIDHLDHATAEDAAILGPSNTVATLLPGASFCGDGRYAPARALIDAGVPVALATNFNAHHTPSLSMQAAVSLACRHMDLTPAEAVSAATINGAHAAGCAERVGSLECGKSADLLFLNVSDYRELAHSLGANLVHMVMKRGEIVYEEGEVARRPVEDMRPPW